MGQKLSTSKQIGGTVGLYLLWLLLAVLWAVVAFQVQTTLLYLGLVVVQTPEIRPTGWNTATISGINRCTFLVLGALWLGVVVFTERYLREGLEQNRLFAYAGRLAVIAGLSYGLGAGLLWLLSWLY